MLKEQTTPFPDALLQSPFYNDNIFFQNDDYSTNSEDQSCLSPSFDLFSSYTCENSNQNSVEDSSANCIKQKKSEINKRLTRKYFTQKEDELLTAAALAYDQKSWNSIAECVPGKTPKQCRDRWVNYLQPSVQNAPWSNQEDQLLTTLVNMHGTHWAKMKSNFPNRSANSIKNRWHWLIKNQAKSMYINGPMLYNINNILANQFPNRNNKNGCKKLKKNKLMGNDHMLNYSSNFNIFSSELNTQCNYSKNQNDLYTMKKNIIEKPPSCKLLLKNECKQRITNYENIESYNNNIFKNTGIQNNQIELEEFEEFKFDEFI